mgnify:CR=1 FL=1
MDKSTLSNYGWIVIITLVLSIMLALATPFGSFVARGVSNVIKYYKTATGDVFSASYMSGKQNEWEEFLDGTIPPNEIDNNPHIYGIGKTKSEYVIAIFNEDYTSVTIRKNGVNSDGLMKDFKLLSSFQTANRTKEEAFEYFKNHGFIEEDIFDYDSEIV